MSIEIIKQTFEQFAKAKEGFQCDIATFADEENGDVSGVRLIYILNPTIQFVYAPKAGPNVAAFVFPGDDAAISAQIVQELGKAIRSALPEVETEVIGVIAPVFVEAGVSFTSDVEQVYDIYTECIRQRAGLPPLQEEADVGKSGEGDQQAG